MWKYLHTIDHNSQSKLLICTPNSVLFFNEFDNYIINFHLFGVVRRRGSKVGTTLGPPTGCDFPPGHVGRQRRQRGDRPGTRLGPEAGVQLQLLAADVLADRFQVQAYGRAPTLVADVMVRPADSGKTVVHRGGRRIRGHGGTPDRVIVVLMVVPMLVHHRSTSGYDATAGDDDDNARTSTDH